MYSFFCQQVESPRGPINALLFCIISKSHKVYNWTKKLVVKTVHAFIIIYLIISIWWQSQSYGKNLLFIFNGRKQVQQITLSIIKIRTPISGILTLSIDLYSNTYNLDWKWYDFPISFTMHKKWLIWQRWKIIRIFLLSFFFHFRYLYCSNSA